MRGGPYPGQRPLLRYPSHGNFPLIGHFPPYLQHQPVPQMHTNEILPNQINPTTTNTSSLIPGQFPPHQQQQQQPLHPFAAQHTTLTPPGGVGANGPPTSQQQHNPNTQNHSSLPLPHPHDPHSLPNPHSHPHPSQLKPRHPFPGYRPSGPGGFRHPNPAGIYTTVPHDYGPGGGNPQFNQNFGPPPHGHPHGPRPMYRPEMQGAPMGVGMPPGMRPGLRMQRPPHNSGMPINPNFGNGPPLRHPQSIPPLQMPINNSAGGMSAGVVGVPGVLPPGGPTQPMPLGGGNSSMQPTTMRPSKVLINPNFKGGVEAATNKFIKETQFMSTISSHVSHLQSDDELLRQQEEFINKNRQHIEKRRHERSPLPLPRRSRSRSPRSHSRERSYSPPKRGGGAGAGPGGGGNERHFERGERDRARERDRERDRLDRGVGAVAASSSVGGSNDTGAIGGDRFMDRERGDRDRERDRGNERLGRANSRERERDRDRPIGGYGAGGGNRGNRFRRGNSRDRDYENRGGGGGGGGNYGKRRRSLSPPTIRGGRRGGDRDRNDVSN